MRVTAPAKLNLRLVVLAREAGGYHQIETIFCRIALADELVIERAATPGLALRVSGADTGPPHDNLVTRAAHAWCSAAGVEPAFVLTLTKRIPVGAGLGGGSSDAAATLFALNAMHDAIVGTDRLLEIGATLGSDVPFFVADAPIAVAWGRGERLLTHPGPGVAPALIVMPDASVATAEAYARMAPFLDDRARPARWSVHDLDTWASLAALARNDFERIVLPAIPSLAPALAYMRAQGAVIAQLTGSGAAVFGIFDTTDARDAAADAIRRDDPAARLYPTDAAV